MSMPGPTSPTLREPVHRVSAKAPLLWAMSAVISSLVVAGIAELADAFGWVSIPFWAFIGYAALALTYIAVMPPIRYRTHRWENTETAVYTQTGWLSRERRIAPMSRVQTVDFEQSAISRLLGLASVTVTTASAAGPLRIADLDRPVADRLVEELTRRTASEGDAT